MRRLPRLLAPILLAAALLLGGPALGTAAPAAPVGAKTTKGEGAARATARGTATTKGGRRASKPRAAPPPIPPHPVLLISIDGLPWPLLQAELSRLPNLRALLRRGVSGPLRTVLPSMTWPAHASMLTGQPPMIHGVVGNRWLDRATGTLQQAYALPMAEAIAGPTLPQLAAAAGIDTAAITWPNTGHAAHIRWNLPEIPDGPMLRAAATPGLIEALAADGVDSGDLDTWTRREGEQLDAFSLAAAIALWRKHQPRLMLLHLLAYDDAAHRRGPSSKQALEALRACDRRVGEMLAAYGDAAKTLDVLVVSDHGFHEVRDGLSPRRALARTKLEPEALATLTPVSNGQSLWLYAADTPEGARALKAATQKLVADGRVTKALQAKAMLAAGLGAAGVQPRAPDVALLLRDDVMLHEPRLARKERRPGWHGMHGGAPGSPQMQAVWIAAGPCFRARQQVRGLRVVDVAPVAAASLGLGFAPGRGAGAGGGHAARKAAPLEGRLRKDVTRCGP